MIRTAVLYSLLAGSVAAATGALGGVLTTGEAVGGVRAGAAIGAMTQLLAFWLLFVWLFPGRLLLAYGLGVLIRVTMLAGVTFAALPLLGLPAAPTLFSLVLVLFVTTLLEPLALWAMAGKD